MRWPRRCSCVGVGVVVHRPLARVPENTIKFVVGLLLTTFGTFWATEGLGAFAADSQPLEWPGGDARAARGAGRLVAVRAARDPAAAAERRAAGDAGRGRAVMRLVTAFGRFCWDFVVGDDWRIAAGVVAVLAAGAVVVARGTLDDEVVTVLVGAGIALVATASIVLPARRAARRGR